ncbi:MAG: hypothetical protein HFG65_04095 [Hungatella sp.]|nr:hypothetical protein [Hungatella sp.]
MEMKPCFIQADRRVFYDAGKAVLVRGPLVYCIEEADNGPYLYECRADAEPVPQKEWEEQLGGSYSLLVPTVRYEGRTQEKLYGTARIHKEKICLKAIPYFLWNNRGQGEMVTWMNVM